MSLNSCNPAICNEAVHFGLAMEAKPTDQNQTEKSFPGKTRNLCCKLPIFAASLFVEKTKLRGRSLHFFNKNSGSNIAVEGIVRTIIEPKIP
jgi:hypothetical protein